MPQPRLAYLSQGRLLLQDTAGAPRTVDSAFANSLRERAAQIQNRRAWKTQGFGAQFMGMSQRMRPEAECADFPIRFTSVARGRAPGEVLYSLETPEISGVFAMDSEGLEQRLFHTADFRVQDLAVRPDGSGIALSLTRGGRDANIAILNGDGSDLREVSEGDSFDVAPHWDPGPRRRLVFQSAGLGRNNAGHVAARGPFSVRQLDLETGALDCLVEEADSDFLTPQIGADGALYYLRRPYKTGASGGNALGALQATVLLPFHLLFGIMRFFSVIAMMYGRKPPELPQMGGGDNPAEPLTLWGETVAIERRAPASGDTDAPALVPSTWQLIRRTEAGPQVLADGILAFDLAPDGTILCSNGRSVRRLQTEGKGAERVTVGNMIAQVAAL